MEVNESYTYASAVCNLVASQMRITRTATRMYRANVKRMIASTRGGKTGEVTRLCSGSKGAATPRVWKRPLDMDVGEKAEDGVAFWAYARMLTVAKSSPFPKPASI